MKRLPFLLVLPLFWCSSFCQTIQFKGQLLQNNNVVSNYTVLVDGKPATTNDAGIFYSPVSAASTQVNIQASDKTYIVLYPLAGRTLIPKDASLITQIVVASFQSNNYLKKYFDISKQLSDSIGKSNSQLNSLRNGLDSVVKVLHKLSYTDTDLRTAKEMQEGKDRNLFDITKDLEDYSRNAQNLISAFQYISAYAFANPNALLQLSEAVTNYNNSYDKLDGKRAYYLSTLNNFWDKNKADSFSQVVSFALDTIHTKNIYPLRDLLQQIRNYFNAGKKSDESKNSIQKQIRNLVAADQQLLDDLKNKTDGFIHSLTE